MPEKDDSLAFCKDKLSSGMKVAVLILMMLFLYLTAITFLPITKPGEEYAKTILPYFLGCIGTFLGYYWGSSSKGMPPVPPEEKKPEEPK